MKWLHWEDRQVSGYNRMLLAGSKLLKFSCHLLKIPIGCGIPPHVDQASEGYEHHRLNIVIWRPSLGTGVMHVKGPAKIFWEGRAILFRPDLYHHYMTPVDFIWAPQSAYILSIGWLRRAKRQAHTP